MSKPRLSHEPLTERQIRAAKRKLFDAVHPDGVCRHEGCFHNDVGDVVCPRVTELWVIQAIQGL